MADKKFVSNVNEKNLVLTRAQSAVISRDYVTAAMLYKQLLKDEPSNVDYLKEIGSIYVKSGEDEKAIPYYEQIITFYPHYIDAMTALGAIYRRLKKYEESINILQRAQDEGRQTGDVNYNLGFTYREMGNYDDAIEAFNIVIRLNPSDVLAHNHLGSIYFAKKDYAKAINSFKRGLQIDQNHPILNYNLARCYGEAKMYTEAIRCFETALKAKPGWIDAIKDFSSLLVTCQKTKEASDLVRHSIELHPNDTKLLCTLGSIYLNQFDYDSAEKTFRRAKNVDDRDLQVLRGLAETLEKEEKPEEALDNVIEALDIAPEDVDVKKQYVHTLLSAKEYDAAETNIREMYENGGAEDPQVLDLYGQYYICTGNDQKAEEYYKQIGSVNRAYKDHYLSAAARYNQIGNVQKAETKAKDFVARDMKNPAGYNMLGKIYTKSGDLQSAVESYDKSRNLRRPNVLADKQISSLQEQLSTPKENAATSNVTDENHQALYETEQFVTESKEFIPEQKQEDEFDFGTMGDSVPMGEALIEEEKSFFDELDDATGKDESALEGENPEPEHEYYKNEDDSILNPMDIAPMKNPYKDIEDESLSPFDKKNEDLIDTSAGFGDPGKNSFVEEPEEPVSVNDLTGEDNFDFDQFDDAFGKEAEEAANNYSSGNSNEMSSANNPAPKDSGYSTPSERMPDYNAGFPDDYQRRLQESMMDSSSRAMETAFQAQRLAQQLADEQQFKNNLFKEQMESLGKQHSEEIEELKQQVQDLKAGKGFDEGVLNGAFAVAEENEDVPVEEAVVSDNLVVDEGSEIVEEGAVVEEDSVITEEPVIAEEDTEVQSESEIVTDADVLSETEETVTTMGTEQIEEVVSEEADTEETLFITIDEFIHALDVLEGIVVEEEPIVTEEVEEETTEIATEGTEQIEEDQGTSLLSAAENLLPTIERILSDENAAVENAEEVELFKKLLSLSEYLPDGAKEEFRSGNIRMRMEYIIAKMSGKPGLLKTAQSLKKSGVLGDFQNETVVQGEPVTNHDIRKVLKYMKKLSSSLSDDTLSKAMCNKIDGILEQIEIAESEVQIFGK